MSMGEFEPFEFSLNGERASDEDILVMEQLALGLIERMPAEYHRQHGYRLDSGEIVQFSSCCCRSEEDIDSLQVSIRLAADDYDNIKFELVHDLGSQDSRAQLQSDEELRQAGAIAQAFIDSGELDDMELAVVRQVQSLIFALSGVISADKMGEIVGEDERNLSKAAERAYQVITGKTDYEVVVREWDMFFDEEMNQQLSIVQHEIHGDVDVGEPGDWVPKLQVEWRDEDGTSYCFSRWQDGSCELSTMLIEDVLKELFEETPAEPLEEDMAVDELKDYLGSDVPGRADVARLTEKLIEAALADLSPAEDNRG
jgi:hypothetical protein